MNIRIIRRFGTSKLNQPFLQKYRQFNPRPLSASDLLLFSNNNSVEDSFEYLKQELPTRWMQMYAEIVAMPIEKPTPLMMAVSDSIHETLLHLLDFADKPANENVISKFNSKLGDYLQRHRTAVDEVALAILEYKDEQIEMEEQGLTTFDLDDAEEKICLGKKVQDECQIYYGKSPDVNVHVYDMGKETNDSPISTIFIPTHLEQICAELIRNAVRATVENNEENPPVEVIISRAKENISIKISDKGKGASLRDQAKWGAYLYSEPPKISLSKHTTFVKPLAGYGYGIPLAAVYARYLGGDVIIQSIQNYGTDVCIYLPVNADSLIEVLPVFTKKTEDYYNSKKKKDTWITGKDINKNEIVF